MPGFSENIKVDPNLKATHERGPLNMPENPKEDVTNIGESKETVVASGAQIVEYINWDVTLSGFPKELKEVILERAKIKGVDYRNVLTNFIVENLNIHKWRLCPYCGPAKLAAEEKRRANLKRVAEDKERAKKARKERNKNARKARKKNR